MKVFTALGLLTVVCSELVVWSEAAAAATVGQSSTSGDGLTSVSAPELQQRDMSSVNSSNRDECPSRRLIGRAAVPGSADLRLDQWERGEGEADCC
ncbi:hypothetical protein WMY93_024290 [Mugilogobius chulae]|uniref:Secreted protein n=1 Tax=Mugilogobius chulae TaxID=88201 RepID=A0AAW0MZ72_9GOBI